MWLINSSIGRKFVMALTGICLVLFVTFHVLMNAVAILWPGAYNQVCQFLGANWYALIASAGLGLLVVIHIIDALVLTIQNRKARGNDRYAVTSRPQNVEWSSQNMLVLGIVVLAFLAVHLVQFWARMQAQEIMGAEYAHAGVEIPAAAGTLFLQIAFEQWWTPVIYIIGFAALWFHMNHGFWSMWQSVGWNNGIWLNRWKAISSWWVSIVIGLFVIQAIVFTIRANEKFYYTDGELQAQYQQMIIDRAEAELEPLASEVQELQAEMQSAYVPGMDIQQVMASQAENQNRYNMLMERIRSIQTSAMNQIAAIKKLGTAEPAVEAAAQQGAPDTDEDEVIEQNIPAEGVSEN